MCCPNPLTGSLGKTCPVLLTVIVASILDTKDNSKKAAHSVVPRQDHDEWLAEGIVLGIFILSLVMLLSRSLLGDGEVRFFCFPFRLRNSACDHVWARVCFDSRVRLSLLSFLPFPPLNLAWYLFDW